MERREIWKYTSWKLRFRNIARAYSFHAELFAHPPDSVPRGETRKSPPPFAGVASTGRLYVHNDTVETSTIERSTLLWSPRAMSPLPRICIQAYADKQHRARAALECINPPGVSPRGCLQTPAPYLHLPMCSLFVPFPAPRP